MAFVIYPTAKIIIDEPEYCSEPSIMAAKLGQNNVDFPHHFKHKKNGDIGDFTFIRAKKLMLGEGVHIAARVTIVGSGSVEIGDYSTIAPGVVIYTSVPDLRYGTNKYAENFKLKEGDVKIGKNCFVGANAVIAQGVTIGDGAVVGAGMYVDCDVPAGKVWRPDIELFEDVHVTKEKIGGYMEAIEKKIPDREMKWQP